MIATPELDKLLAVRGKEEISAFMDWLRHESGLVLAERIREDLWPTGRSPEAIMAAYFGIDMKAVERERQALLDEIRRTG